MRMLRAVQTIDRVKIVHGQEIGISVLLVTLSDKPVSSRPSPARYPAEIGSMFLA